MSDHKMEIERKFLWLKDPPSKAPDKSVQRCLFPKTNGIERRVQKSIDSKGHISYEDQIKKDLPDGSRESTKHLITKEEFDNLTVSSNMHFIERDEYYFDNDDPTIDNIQLVVYPQLKFARLEIEFIDQKSANGYIPLYGTIEITGPLLRDETLSTLDAVQVKQEIAALLKGTSSE